MPRCSGGLESLVLFGRFAEDSLPIEFQPRMGDELVLAELPDSEVEFCIESVAREQCEPGERLGQTSHLWERSGCASHRIGDLLC